MQTLYDKLWEAHRVCDFADGATLLYIDRHLIHEVTSAQAFEGLRLAGRRAWRPQASLAVMDHSVPTTEQREVQDPMARRQLDALRENCAQTGIRLLPMRDRWQGIVHVVGPEQGFCQPGMTVVCGDSHTSTNGALSILAFGIGTSEVEHVLATQCLVLRKSGNLRIEAQEKLCAGVSAKDLALAIIGRIGTAGAVGHTIEYAGEAVRELSMEGRMTLCNMSIEAGARAGLIAVDERTIEYMRGRPCAPRGALWEQAVSAWKELRSDAGARFDRTETLRADQIAPQVTWGTSPEMVAAVADCVPDPAAEPDADRRRAMCRALEYMDLVPGTPMTEISVDRVFLGSCTNARIEDFRAAAKVLEGRRVAPRIIQALAVPGSEPVRRQAEQEGLARIFIDAGFEWRRPGCSMCLGMNPDQLGAGERCAATSNRNFEGRQGAGGRTHLVSPSMAAAAAVAGHFVDVREFQAR